MFKQACFFFNCLKKSGTISENHFYKFRVDNEYPFLMQKLFFSIYRFIEFLIDIKINETCYSRCFRI